MPVWDIFYPKILKPSMEPQEKSGNGLEHIISFNMLRMLSYAFVGFHVMISFWGAQRQAFFLHTSPTKFLSASPPHWIVSGCFWNKITFQNLQPHPPKCLSKSRLHLGFGHIHSGLGLWRSRSGLDFRLGHRRLRCRLGRLRLRRCLRCQRRGFCIGGVGQLPCIQQGGVGGVACVVLIIPVFCVLGGCPACDLGG